MYLDTAPIIYVIERVSPYVSAVDARLNSSGLALVTSDLTRLECRVKPLRDGDTNLLAEFDAFFAEAITTVVALTRDVVDRATELRAAHGVRTPDALHLAAAMLSGCDIFYTNDHWLDHVPGITVEIVATVT
jgi:predicted nucleic acid-binding protein